MSSDMGNCRIQTEGVSRRNFLRTLGAASAAAAAFPAAAAYGQQATAALTTPTPTPRRGMSDMGEMRQLSPDTVIISSNENPLVPASVALSAIGTTAAMGGRYHKEESMQTVKVFSGLFDLPVAAPGKPGYVALFPGSGGPLDLALMSNIGPDKPLVFGDPSYEQGPRAADAMGATQFPVKMTPT